MIGEREREAKRRALEREGRKVDREKSMALKRGFIFIVWGHK